MRHHLFFASISPAVGDQSLGIIRVKLEEHGIYQLYGTLLISSGWRTDKYACIIAAVSLAELTIFASAIQTSCRRFIHSVQEGDGQPYDY